MPTRRTAPSDIPPELSRNAAKEPTREALLAALDRARTRTRRGAGAACGARRGAAGVAGASDRDIGNLARHQPIADRCSAGVRDGSSPPPRGYCAATWRSCCFATATPIFTRPGRRRRVRWRTSRPTGSRLILTPTFPRAPSSRSRSCICRTGRRSTFLNTNAAFTRAFGVNSALYLPLLREGTSASAFSRWPEVGRTCSARAKSPRPVRFATRL